MTNRERFVNTLNFKPVDRLPIIEYSAWWNKTIRRWWEEGLPRSLNNAGMFHYWNLDLHHQFMILSYDMEMSQYQLDDIDAYIRDEADYEKVLPSLYPKDLLEDNGMADDLRALKAGHDAGDFAIWFAIEGYFWWPRVLFGIEPHLFSFYDHPELYKRICSDLMDFHLRVIEEFCSILRPDFVSIYEDMSYNHGPMLSEATFHEFIKPYYEKIIPALHKHGVKVVIDTDGDVSSLVPWFLGCGADGITPMERRAGVDAVALRETYPQLIMCGAYDKTVMSRGEAAMRKEFERLIPVMKSGGYLLSVDHQTPPDVSMENYAIYRRLQDEYCGKYHP